MHPIFDKTAFEKASSRQPFDLECQFCHEIFQAPKNEIQKVMSGRPERTLDFCSFKCSRASTDTRRSMPCKNCGTQSIKSAKDIRDSKSGNVFCSKSCAAKWNNTHKTKGTRVSKLERWLAARLPELYPGIEFHFNRTDAIDAELDIFVPSLRLAFELNGIFHYEPIYGPEKLASIRSNDARKSQACVERGIEFCTIDVSTLKHFKEHRAQRFLDIVASVIDRKQSLVSSPQQAFHAAFR